MVKVLLSYTMKPGREEECQRYVMQVLAPGLARLGLQITDAWYTMWGDAPQILGGGVLKDEDQARRLLSSPEWATLVEGLEPLVEEFHVKVVRASGRFQY